MKWALLVLFVMGCDTSRVDSINLTAEGMNFFKSGQTSKAIEAFRKAIELDPDNEKAHFRLGMIYNGALHDYLKAIEAFKKAVELDAETGEYWYYLGFAQSSQASKLLKERSMDEALRFMEEARRSLEKAVALDEYHAEAWLRLARLLMDLGEVSLAIDAYMNCIRANPVLRTEEVGGTAVAYLELGMLYEEYSFLDEALQVLSNGIANNPEDIRLEAELGNVFLEMKRYTEAVPHFERAYLLREETGAPVELVLPALYGQGMAYAELGNQAMRSRDVPESLKQMQSAKHWLALFVANVSGDAVAQRNAAQAQLSDVETALRALEEGQLPQYILDQAEMNAPKDEK
ncbi:MAG: tetratricopeptide repeat protein [Myxococcota bacterium]|nr:tetratricopeptide repeat protein [Myxococcota bacterium]